METHSNQTMPIYIQVYVLANRYSSDDEYIRRKAPPASPEDTLKDADKAAIDLLLATFKVGAGSVWALGSVFSSDVGLLVLEKLTTTPIRIYSQEIPFPPSLQASGRQFEMWMGELERKRKFSCREDKGHYSRKRRRRINCAYADEYDDEYDGENTTTRNTDAQLSSFSQAVTASPPSYA